jgi:hypothetical protein
MSFDVEGKIVLFQAVIKNDPLKNNFRQRKTA